MVVSKLESLHQKIVKHLERQLELPFTDLPPKVLKQLTIPDFLKINLYSQLKNEQYTELGYSIEVSIQDTAAPQATFDAAKEVIKFIDANTDMVERAVYESLQDMMQSGRDVEREQSAKLDDSTKHLLRAAQALQAVSSNSVIKAHLGVVGAWKVGGATDEEMLQAVSELYNFLEVSGKLPEGLAPPQASGLQESSKLDSDIRGYFAEATGEAPGQPAKVETMEDLLGVIQAIIAIKKGDARRKPSEKSYRMARGHHRARQKFSRCI